MKTSAIPRRMAALALTTAAAVTISLAGASPGQAAGRLPTLPDAPKAMITAQRLAETLSPDLGGPPVGNPATALSRVKASALATATPDACGGMNVVDSITGTGASTHVAIKTSTISFAVNGVPITWWKAPPVSTPVWQLYFRGLMWQQNVAYRALTNGDAEAIDALVVTAAESVAKNPDPGTAINGWDEGTNLRRQQALSCLYRASNGDARLIPAITATAKANMDTSRYYGLPNCPPHNHGLMANLALLDAGELLNNATWKSVAVSRLVTDSAGAFTAGGVSIEQSSGYHTTNADLWSLVADTLVAYPDASISGAAPGIRARVAKARIATAHMTDPRGHLVPYGDADDTTFPVTAQASGTFRDDAAGLVTGRWSWTDPKTSYYLLRYGPARRAHGHEDRTELVWTTLGVPVLIDPGTFSYDPGIYHTFQISPIAHDVQTVNKRTFVPGAVVKMGATTTSGSVHAYSTTDTQYGLAHTRSWRIDTSLHQVTLTDKVAAASVTSLHFDSTWNAVTISSDHKTITLRHPSSGRTASIHSSAPMTIYRQSTRPVLGWQFPAYGQRAGAVQILVNTPAGTSTTTVKVS